MKKTIKYLQDGEYHYATVKDVGDVEQLKTKHKEDLVTALNELFTTGGEAKPTGYDDLVKKVNDTQTNLNGINGEVSSVKDKVSKITSNGGGRNLVANTGTDIVVDATSDNASDYKFATLNFAEQPKQGDLITVSAEGTLTGTGTLDEYQVVLYNLFTTNPRSQAQYLKAGKRDSVTLSLDNLNGDGDTVLLIYAGKAGETKGKKNVIHHLMVEKGTIAHDWQPAPEDTDSAIESVSSKIDQTADGINNTITDINGKVVANDEAIVQAKKDLQDALTQFQTFNDEIEQAKKDAESKLADAKQALKDEFNNNLADAQKANQKQLEDKIAVIQGNLDTTSNTLNDVKTQLTNARLDYGNVNVSIQKLNDMLATKLSSTDLDPLRASIQNQESEIQQTKDSIATKAGKAEFDVLSGRVSNTEAKIKQQADEISLGVKKSELNGAIDNYQIEGTNRLRDTIDFDIDNGYWKLDQYSINSNTDVHPYDQAHDVSALVLQKTGSAKQDVDFTNEDLGNSFVISVWNKKDAQPQVWYGNTRLTNRQVAAIKGDYERSFFTFIPTNINVKTIMFKYDAGTVDQLVIGEPKLELGTEPKTYAPNPNDEHKQIVNTKAELKIASDKIESTVEKQTKTDDNINQLSSRVTQTEQGITATNDLITKTKDGLIKDYTGKINASAKSLSSEFEEKTDEKIGQITDSGENLILNSAFTNETDRKDKWQNISDKVNIVADNNGLMWAKMSQSGLTSDNPIGLTSNYFPIKQGKITVGVDVKSDNTNGLSGVKILVLQTYNANKQRVDFTELTLENMGLTVQQLADGQSHRGVYRLGNDRSDAVYMTVKAVLPRNGSIYFTNFSAKLSSIDNGGYTPNAEDLKRQILNQKTKIEQNSQQITLKASSTELRDVRTIANGAVSSANDANNTANQANKTADTANSNANQANSKITDMQANGGGRNLLWGTSTLSGDVTDGGGIIVKGAFNGYDAVKTNTAWGERTINLQSALGRTNAKAGDWYTISVYVKADKQINTGGLAVYRALGNVDANTNDGFLDGIPLQTKPITTQWQQYAWSFQINDISLQRQNTRVEYNQDTGDNWIYWAGWMLEKGTVAHEWQPAPEDIQSQINQARTDIQSTLTVANNGITAATNLKTTYDNYVQKNDANIKLLGDRITNEVSKITSNGGGRNLWLNSKSFKQCNINVQPVNWNTDSDGITTAHITGAGGFYGKWAQIYANSTDPFAIGDSETFSVEMKGTGTITIGREHDFEKAVTLTNTWTRYSVSGVVKAANRAHIMYNESGKDCDAYVRLPMVEKGTIAHDWQPAPEDTNSQIEAVSSKIDQTATSITSTVNSTKQDLQGQINSANTKITQTANGITEQLKSYSKTGDMQNYVDTTIKKTSDGIEQTVKKITDVQNNVDRLEDTVNGIQVGGRNLVTGTEQDIVIDNTDNPGDLGWRFSSFNLTQQPKVGDQITVSSEGTLTGRGNLGTYDVILYNSATTANRSNSRRLTAGKRSSATLEVTNLNGTGDTVLLIYAGNIGDTAGKKNVIHHLKVEFGNQATDWTQAPEDIEQTIKDATEYKTVTGTIDFNNLKTQQKIFYKDTQATNTPAGGNYWYYLDVEPGYDGRILQTAISDRDNITWVRTFAYSWSPWVKQADQRNIDDLNNQISSFKTETTASVKNLGDRVTTEVNSITKKINDSHTNDVELIRNNNFPDGNKGSWNGNLTTVIDGNSIPAELGQNGMKVLRVIQRDTYEDDIWYSVKPGEIFDVDYWIWPTGSYDSRLGLYFVDKDKGASDWRGVVAKKGTGWTHYTGTIEAPSNAAFAKPWIQVEKDASETDSAAWIGKPSIRRHDSFAEQKINEINTKLDVANGKIEGKVTEKQVHDLLNNEHYATESWTQAQLKLTSDNFNVSVGKMAQKLDNLTIGGRNLIYGTTDFELLYSGTFTDSITIRQVLIDNELAQKASTMTYSATIRPEDAESPVQLAIYKTKGDSAHTRVSNTPIAISSIVHYSDSKRLSLTFNLDQDMKEIEIVALVAGSNTFKMFGVKEEKLEIGSVPTDWSPAPEEYAKTSNIISTINMSPEQIKLSSNKIVLDGDTEIKGTAFIPSAAIKDITADKITAGTLDVGKLDIKNLKADDIKTGTLSGITVRAGDEDSFFQTSKDNIYWITKSSGSALIGRGKYVRYPGLNVFDKEAIYLGSWAGAVLNQDGTINDRGGAYGNPKLAIETAGMKTRFNGYSFGGDLEPKPLDRHRITSWVGPKEFLLVEQGNGTHIELNPNMASSQFTVQKDNRFGAYFGQGREGNEINFTPLGGMTVNGNFRVTGAKNAIVKTSQGTVAINAYETADYYFGDIGSAKTGDSKVAMIDIESLFKETVNTDVEYQVFLTSYGPGDIWVSERQRDYFVVESELPNMEFGWEIKAKRKGYENTRLAKVDVSNVPTV